MAQPTATPSDAISASDYSPLSPQVRANPYPYYAALRRDDPVRQILPGMPFFALSRYADVQFALYHPELFSSTAFRMLTQTGGLGPNSGALAGHRIIETPMMISVDPDGLGLCRLALRRARPILRRCARPQTDRAQAWRRWPPSPRPTP